MVMYDMSKSLSLRVRGKNFTIDSRPVAVLREVELDIVEGEFVTVLGPSGCGKTTLLRLIAGLDTEFDGTIKLGGTEVSGPSLERGVIFQEPRLMPWRR